MGIKDFVSGVTEKLAKLTPDPVEDLLLGGRKAPPTPTTPEEARTLIDATVGRLPSDQEIVRQFHGMDMTTRLLEAVDTAENGVLNLTPYDPAVRAKWATGGMVIPPDPYTIADMDLQRLFQNNPRASLVYAREYDPMNKELLPVIVEANAKRHGGLLSWWKNTATDLLGRPIGSAIELLGKPAKWAEEEYGSRFVWNDIGDASLRHTMAKYTYEARLNVRDWNYSWENRARDKARTIESQGLRGDAASAEFEKWIDSEGNPGAFAAISDLAGQIVFDPLWLIPAGTIFKGGGKLARTASGVEEGKSLSRLFRIPEAITARSKFGFDTIREMLSADNTTYSTAKITTPGLRGSLLWLTERPPTRMADATSREVSLTLSGPLLRTNNLGEQLDVLAHFEDTIRKGKVTGRAAEYFGADLFERSPVLADFSALANTEQRSALEGLLDGLQKHPELSNVPVTEVNKLILRHVTDMAGTIALEAQTRRFPKFFNKRVAPIVSWQKQAMSYFTLSTPRFMVYNFGNNLFTYLWQAARHPASAANMYRQSMRAEWGSKELPELTKSLAFKVGIDPTDIEHTVAGNVTRRELLGNMPGQGFRLDDDALDIKEALRLANQAVDKPVKDLTKFRFRDLLAWPIVGASKLDRQTRRATFYQSINEQLNLGMSRARTMEGLVPDLHRSLIDVGVEPELAARWEDYMISHMRTWLHSPEGTLANSAAVREAWLDGMKNLTEGKAHGYLSAYNYAMRYAAEKGGLDDIGATHWLRDLDPAIVRTTNEALARLEDADIPTVMNSLDRIADEYLSVDEVLARATSTPPIIRPSTDYSRALPPESVMREDMTDAVRHIDRLANRVLPDWTGAAPSKRRIFSSAESMIHGRLSRLAHIRTQKINALATGKTEAEDWKKIESELWGDYWQFQAESQREFFDVVRAELGGVDEHVLGQVESWYATLLKTQEKHRDMLKHAMSVDSPEAWRIIGEQVENLYSQAAIKRADIFGVNMNETPMNMGYTRPTAPLVTQVMDYIDYIKLHLPQDVATARSAGDKVKAGNNAIDVMTSMADDVAERAPDLARHLVANARAKTDFVMLDYDSQRGADTALQMFFPYEFFPTRTAINWGIRVARNPGAGAALALMILNPGEYAERYGVPSRLRFKIPIPMPFLQDWLRGLPVIGDKLQNAEFSNVYWVDPLQYMFPLTSFRDQYENDKQTTAGLGGIASFAEEYNLNLSPFAKIIGGYTGLLDRDAWTNAVFQGGPFGIPMTAYGAAVGRWIYNGDGSEVPDEEKDIFSSVGRFSKGFLANILGLSPDRFDTYRRERALAALVADGSITSEDAQNALFTHSGPAWNKAVKASESEQFLTEFTGYLGFRLAGSLKGENIIIGQKALYSKAAAEGGLSSFYEKYPEYQVYKLAVRGLSDPVEQQKELETQLYYRDLESYVNQPYQKTLDTLQNEIASIRGQETLIQTDNEQIQFFNDNIAAIKDEQQRVREMLDRAYPNRTKEPSVRMPPKERALRQAAEGWYDLQQGQGEGVAADETYEDFLARRDTWLRQFPARGLDQDESDWEQLFVSYRQTTAKYNLMINKAYNEGDFDKGAALQEERDALIEAIHEQSEQRVTRYDVEYYLAQFQRRATPAEVEFNDARAMWGLWMSLVTDGSPLNSTQKAAVSAYFRAQPLLRKHYNASTIDIRLLNGDQLVALARRNEILDHYYGLGTDDAKIDYMRSVAGEYNEANSLLGLPPALIVDARPDPPHYRFGDPSWAAKDFAGSLDTDNYILSGMDFDPEVAVTMSPEDIRRYIDSTIARGY